MSKLVDNLLKNPDVSRVLVLAVAAEAKRSGEPIDSKDLAVKFSRLVRVLDRKAFAGECRRLERIGPDRYLRSASRLLEKK